MAKLVDADGAGLWVEQAARISGARLELLPGQAHQPFQSAPEESDRIVLGFLTAA